MARTAKEIITLINILSRKPVPLAMLSVFIWQGVEQVSARSLQGPDASATVTGTAPIESWSLADGASLNVAGGSTDDIRSVDSTVNLNNATVSGAANPGLYLGNSTATVRGSTLSSGGTTLNVNQGSTARVFDSTITGVGRGVNVAGGSDVLLSNTSVVGNDDGKAGFLGGGAGLAVVNGNAIVTDGSRLVGDHHGVTISPDRFNGDDGRKSSLVLDGSHVEGKNGSAIRVSSYIDNRPADVTISVKNQSTLVGGNGVILDVDMGATVAFNVANSALTGDIQVAEGAHAAVTLRDNASLYGAINGVEQLNVGSGAAWTLDKDSSVQALTLNNGRVNLGGGDGIFHQLSLESLSGNGVFGLGTDLAAGQGDKLVISGEATGSHLLAIQNTGADVAEGKDPLAVVHTSGGDAQFGAVGGQVDLGTFVYDLQKQGDDWFLVQRPGEVVTPGTRSVLALFNAAPTVWYGESTTLRSRMGELRMGTATAGLWSRAYGSRQDISSSAGVGYQQQQRGLTLGADAPVAIANGQAAFGVMAGYSNSDLDVQGGTKGTIDSYHAGLYGTWLGDDGYYMDAMLKANRFENKANVRMSDGSQAKGDYSNLGLGATFEAGRRLDLGTGLFATPFAQGSVLRVQGRDYSLDNGMRAQGSNTDSLLGKVGSQFGRTYTLGNGSTFEPTLKAAVAHEFASGNQARVNANRFSNNLSGTRGELGVGVAAQVSKNTQLYGDFDYIKGRNIEQPWGLSLGARVNF